MMIVACLELLELNSKLEIRKNKKLPKGKKVKMMMPLFLVSSENISKQTKNKNDKKKKKKKKKNSSR